MSNADTTSPAIPFTAQMGTIFASQHDYLELYSNLRGMPPGGPWSQTIWYTSPDGASMVVYDIATGPQPKSSVLLAQIASTTTQTAAVATQIEDALNTKVVPELHNLHAAINALSKRLPGPPGGFDVHGSNGSNGGGPYLSPTPSPDTNS
jgi:hypothetical protein